jgi:acyl-CoA reductase-like NAD-dependent aldehyde dehydrogenase
VNSGQVCMSTERVLVHDSIAKEFERVLRDTASALDKREGFELCRPGAVDNVRALVKDATDQVRRDTCS